MADYLLFDALVQPRKEEYDAIIIECKVQNRKREKNISDTVQAALRQIEEKKYEAALPEKGIAKERIRKVGNTGLSSIFKFSMAIGKAIYTTNAIESLNFIFYLSSYLYAFQQKRSLSEFAKGLFLYEYFMAVLFHQNTYRLQHNIDI